MALCGYCARPMTIVLTLYTRAGCCLCEDMLETLAAFQRELGFSVDAVDIDQDSALRRRYTEKVPVLALGEREICHYFLDKVALCAALDEVR